ncbi:MAG: hypothetical protein GQ577_03895 [Woeseiaceae bacterium]|nr:hypothetical protein [Woeseiaceae bacterium]
MAEITAEQLREMRESGDEIEFHDTGHRSIDGFDKLVAELRSLVEAQRTNAVADMLRSEAQEKLIGLLQEMVSQPADKLDMTPLKDMMVEMQAMSVDRPRTGYEFAIDRDGQGFMRSITATPISPTIN